MARDDNPYSVSKVPHKAKWFSGVPQWLKTSAKIAFLAWLPLFLYGIIRAVIVLRGRTFNNTPMDVIQCLFGKEARDILERLF